MTRETRRRVGIGQSGNVETNQAILIALPTSGLIESLIHTFLARTGQTMEPNVTESGTTDIKRRHPLITTLWIVLSIFFILLALLVGAVAMQPKEFRLERSRQIAAPPEAVFAQVNDFHNWQKWSPWAKLDPDAKNTYSGPDAGEGARFAWDGNDDVGAGQMTIVESRPNELVQLKLEFTRPMENVCDTIFTFTPSEEGTLVTWSMAGSNSFLGKAVHLLIDMDKMVGAQFEEGLTNLQQIVELATTP